MEQRDLIRLLIFALIITVADATFSYVMGRNGMDGDHITLMALAVTILCAIRDKD